MAARRIGTAPALPPPVALLNPHGMQLPLHGPQTLIIYPSSNPVLNQVGCSSNGVYKPGVPDLLTDCTYGDLDTLVSEFEQEMRGTMIEMENDEICKEILESRCEEDPQEEERETEESDQKLTTLDPGYINKYLSQIEDSGHSKSMQHEFTDIKSSSSVPVAFNTERLKPEEHYGMVSQRMYLNDYAVATETVETDTTDDNQVETIVCEPCTVTVTTSADSQESQANVPPRNDSE